MYFAARSSIGSFLMPARFSIEFLGSRIRRGAEFLKRLASELEISSFHLSIFQQRRWPAVLRLLVEWTWFKSNLSQRNRFAARPSPPLRSFFRDTPARRREIYFLTLINTFSSASVSAARNGNADAERVLLASVDGRRIVAQIRQSRLDGDFRFIAQPSASAALPSFAVLARFVSDVVERVGEIGFQLVDDLDDRHAPIHRRSLRAWR